MDIKISSSFEWQFNSQLEALNKKLVKLHLDQVEVLSKDHIVTEGGDFVKFVLSDVERKIKGHEYVGDICYDKETDTLQYDGDIETLQDAKHTLCDHCHSKRKRKKVHVFKHEGKLVSIGSTCAKAYFGFQIKTSYADISSMVEDFEERMSRCVDSEAYKPFKLQDLKNTVASYYAKASQQWMNRHSEESSWNRIVDMYDNGTLREEVVVDLSQYKNAPLTDTFRKNIELAIFDKEGEEREYISRKLGGLVSWAIFDLIREQEEIKEETANSGDFLNEYIGEKGEKILVKVERLKKMEEYESSYGYHVSNKVNCCFNTMKGEVEVDTASEDFTIKALQYKREGGTFYVMGTVDEQYTKHGVKKTYLKRPKAFQSESEFNAAAKKLVKLAK